MSNNSLINLIYLIENGSNKEVQDCINNLKGRVTLLEYNSIIDAVFKKLNLQDEVVLRNLFNQKPQFSIKTYKDLLSMKATREFNKLKDQKSSVFVLLSTNVCKDLEKMDVDQVIAKYNLEFSYIKEVKMFSEFVHLIREYKESLLSCDSLRINNSKAKIREFFRKFNLKYKVEYIKKDTEKKINEIKDDFEIKPKYESENILLSKDSFLKLSISDIQVTSALKQIIKNYFGIESENSDLKKLISNILDSKDMDNYNYLGISINMQQIEKKLLIYNDNKTFHRLDRIYSKILNQFQDEDKEKVIDIIKNNKLKQYRNFFNGEQIDILNSIITIFNECNCDIRIINNKIVFTKEDKLNNNEFELLKEDIDIFKKYKSFRRVILDYYYSSCEKKQSIILNRGNNTEDCLTFDDDNYQLKNNISILNYEILLDILKKIDYNKIRKYSEEQINFLKKILYKEGLLACIMKYDKCIDISKIINGIDFCNYLDDKNIDLDNIIKLTSIYSIADDFSISILGSDVIRKIICNEQFLQTNTDEDKKNRIKKAVHLNILSQNVTSSSIPYDIETSYNNITISRFNNNNPKILSSGIETGTCFKLDGDDNDFVIYTVMNKNGAVLKIKENDNFLGRISVIRNCKVLFLNSIRIKGEKEEKISKEIIDRNNRIFNCLLKLSYKIIDIAKQNNDEIDFIVCNKAGILESSFFNNIYDIILPHIVSQPIDMFNEDWNLFIKLPQHLLKQSNRGEKIPFTTDYGHYPALLIASNENKKLTRLLDIGYDSPASIYERPQSETKIYTSNFDEILEQIYRIDALNYYEEVNDISLCQQNYKKLIINLKEINRITLNDYYYRIEYKDGKVREVSLNNPKSENNKKLVKK